MSHRSQIRWNFWNRLKNEDTQEVLIFGQKWPFLVVMIFEFFHSRYQGTLHKNSVAHSQNFFSGVYWDTRNCQKMAFLTEFSWQVCNFISQPISKISTDLRSIKKRILSYKTREKNFEIWLILLFRICYYVLSLKNLLGRWRISI